MATEPLQQMFLADLEHVHRPAAVSGLRRRIEQAGGVERLLEERVPGDVLRDAVVRRLGYETFLEVAAQAGTVPATLVHDEQTVSDLFAVRAVLIDGPSHRWLTELHARRIEHRHALTFEDAQGDDVERAFFDFGCLRTAMLHDEALEAFIAELSVPTANSIEVLLEPFASPEVFIEAVGNAAAGEPADWSAAHAEDLEARMRLTHAFLGFQRFLVLRLDLADALARPGIPHPLRTGFWHYLAGWFDAYGSRQGFAAGLRLAALALDRIFGWERQDWTETALELQRHRRAHAVLATAHGIPREWRRVLDVDIDDESGGDLAGIDPLSPSAAPAGTWIVDSRRGTRREPLREQATD
jgi:hypothetical protein